MGLHGERIVFLMLMQLTDVALQSTIDTVDTYLSELRTWPSEVSAEMAHKGLADIVGKLTPISLLIPCVRNTSTRDSVSAQP